MRRKTESEREREQTSEALIEGLFISIDNGSGEVTGGK